MDARIFEQLKRPRWNQDRFASSANPKEVIPQLVVAPGGKALLRLVDPGGKVVEPDYRPYSGPLRALIKAWNHARAENEDAFAWGSDGEIEEGIGLANYPGLIPLMRQCPKLVDSQMRPIRCATTTMKAGLRANALEDGASFQTAFVLRAADGDSICLNDALPVSDSAFLEDQTLYPVEPIGPAYGAAGLFADTVPLVQLELFLTLFVSNFPSLTVEIEGFAGEEGSPEEAKPALVFREVDQDENLLLDASYTVAGLPTEFLRDYDVSRMVRSTRTAAPFASATSNMPWPTWRARNSCATSSGSTGR